MTQSYPVLSPISSDRIYKIGDTIELEDAAAEELKFYGAIGEATGKAAAPKGDKPSAAAELIEQLKVAATEEDVDTILGADTRATVVAAAAARKTELAG